MEVRAIQNKAGLAYEDKDGRTRLRQFANMAKSSSQTGRSTEVYGKVIAIGAAGVQVAGLSRIVKRGDLVQFCENESSCFAEVVLIEPASTTVKLLGNSFPVKLDMAARYIGELFIRPCEGWLGRTLSSFAEPVDGFGPLPQGNEPLSIHNAPLAATGRAIVNQPLQTGVRCVDIFTPLCFGQRIGIFAGSGVGKSTLLAMVARAPGFDVAVVTLVGERGREVNEFIHDVLGETMRKCVLVVATGDEAPGVRKMTPELATRIAEHFRDQGKRVLLIMDSVTRYAMAAREVALAAGEAPVSRGYPPSVFSDLPRLLERAGPGSNSTGSITGIYSVLVDGDNHNEPIADAVRGTLDGHIVLDRDIANSGRYPAIDILASISRLSQKSLSVANAKLSADARHLINRFESSKDLRQLGSYQSGSDNELDHAIESVPRIYSYLTQSVQARPDMEPFSNLALLTKLQRSPQAAAALRPTS